MGKLVHGRLDLADSSTLTANPAPRSPLALEKTTKYQFPLVGRGEVHGYDPRWRQCRGAPEVLGFGANNKKKLPTQPRISQDLSISNIVTISWRFGDVPSRPNAGIMPPHRC
jgi:hypothetical protein